MARLGTIDFDDCILDTLRDDKLVVFAGAGISMGPPSNLASFEKLANDIAMGTGQIATAPLDRFLGQLQHRKVAVHERAAQLLSPPGSAPNPLHHDLLRLFHSVERIRLVTTNFDQHFETAAESIFGKVPDVYRAPALPLGNLFSGIVHVHGVLTHPQDMVLTDADFGRAYLTEGWARRFLVEVFRKYTVLFVGYSHTDLVMNYLARALPAESVAGRFALTEEDGSWDLLGIRPIRYKKSAGPNAYKELYDGVQRLAERATRGALDWQSRMAEIGGHAPPVDEEANEEVEQALREVHTTRFLINVARDAAWPGWLNTRKYLDALFDVADLNERDKLLAWWLAEHYAIEHSDAMFDLIASHKMRLNPVFWWAIARELGVMKEKELEESSLNRWVTILLASAPKQADHHALMWLAERCAAQGGVNLTMKVFLFMGEHHLEIKPGFYWYDQEEIEHGQRMDVQCPLRTDHWSMNEVWTKYLKPQLATVIQPLLSGITHQLEDIHSDLVAWEKASTEWDPISYSRSAIEPHDQDRYPGAIDVLIDAARDALEWLAGNSPALLVAWTERLVSSEVPLLRRLAVHAITLDPAMSADDQLNWLLGRVGLYSLVDHHEIYRAAALAYPVASRTARKAFIDAVLAHQQPAHGDWTAEKATAREHFDWLVWLQQADPVCQLAQEALAPIRDQYPEWRQSDHPDLTHWSGPVDWAGPVSPWSVEVLLARSPSDQLDDLLNFKGHRFEDPDRDGLISAIKETCKQRPSWSFELAKVLVKRALWTSDLWPAIMRGWQEAELSEDEWQALLSELDRPELQSAQPDDIADVLYSLVRDGGKPFALDVLERANAIALPVWLALKHDNRDDNITEWSSRAINRPAGVLVEYWIAGLSLLMRGKSGDERILPDDYRQWFTMVVQEPTSKGGLGRSVLAGFTAFLFGLDEGWTRQHVIPLFSDPDQKKFAQAWDGFMVLGRLYPALIEAMMPAFLGALPRLDADFNSNRDRFIEFYTALVVFHVNDPTQELIPALFQNGSAEDRLGFASRLGNFLRQMQEDTKQLLWGRWLGRYWRERQQAVPAALDEAEFRKMLEWLPHLGDSFPEAASLAINSPTIRIEHSQLLYNLRESELVTRYPAETAELLIYLSNCVAGYHAADLGTVAARLQHLAPEVRIRLDEALARIGANRLPPQ